MCRVTEVNYINPGVLNFFSYVEQSLNGKYKHAETLKYVKARGKIPVTFVSLKYCVEEAISH